NYAGQGQGKLPFQALQGQLTTADLAFDLDTQQLTLPSLQLTTQNTGQTDFVAQQADVQLNLTQLLANLKQQTFQADNLALQAYLQGDQLPKGNVKAALSMQPQADLQKQTAQLKALRLEVMDVKADGQIEASQLLDAPKVTASLKVPQTNLRALLNDLKIALPEMRDPKTLTRLAAAFNVDYDGGKEVAKVSNVTVTLDDSQLTGSASVAQFEQPDIRWDLSLNQIDLNRYLPPKPAETSQPSEPKTPPASSEEAVIELPVELLRSLTLNGTFKAGDIRFDKLNPKNLLVVVKGEPGVIQISRLTTDIFNTQLNAQASLDVRDEVPKYAFKTDTHKLPVEELLITFADTDQLSGTGHVQADITTRGDRVSQFKQHLNGTVKLDLKDGAVKGFNLAKSIRDARAIIRGDKTQAKSEPLQTDFSTMVMHATIENGVVTTDTLKAAAPYMRIRGEGTINLPQEQLDYRVYTSIVDTSKGQGGDALKDLDDITIPVKLSGDFQKPKVSLDLESLLKEKAKQEVQKQLDEQKEKLQKEAQKKIEEQLKGQLNDQQKDALKGLGDQLLKNLPF
ncbi:MAG: AsmA family protein, partial [Hydrogenovibrio sp.]